MPKTKKAQTELARQANNLSKWSDSMGTKWSTKDRTEEFNRQYISVKKQNVLFEFYLN